MPDDPRTVRTVLLNPKMTFTSLMGMVFDTNGLLDSFDRQFARKATGVDWVQKDTYEVGVEDRISALPSLLKGLAYRPKSSLRVYIPKDNWGVRTLGKP